MAKSTAPVLHTSTNSPLYGLPFIWRDASAGTAWTAVRAAHLWCDVRQAATRSQQVALLSAVLVHAAQAKVGELQIAYAARVSVAPVPLS